MTFEIIYYIFLALVGVTITHTLLVLFEIKTKKRLFKTFRENLDNKAHRFLKRIHFEADMVGENIRKGGNQIDKDLIEPISEPFIKTKEKYNEIKTGRKKVHNYKISKISKHLRELLKR